MYINWFWLTVAVLSTIGGVIFVKEYLLHPSKPIFLLFSFLSEAILVLSYIHLFSQGNVGTLYTLTKIISIILVVLLSIVLFHQRLKWYQVIGIILAILSILFISKE